MRRSCRLSTLDGRGSAYKSRSTPINAWDLTGSANANLNVVDEPAAWLNKESIV